MTMDPDKRTTRISAGTIIGWCVLAAGIGQVPVIVAGLLTQFNRRERKERREVTGNT
jgi:hypothetical protein